jgi:hypothetical protein
MAINLNYSDYILRRNIGLKNPPRLTNEFINIDRGKYIDLQHDSRHTKSVLYWLRFRKRITYPLYQEIRAAYRKSNFNGERYLPANKFFWKEMINSEWLATVDWKKYHRDHLIHQNLTGYVGMILLNGRYPQNGIEETFQFNERSLKDIIVNLICTHPSCKYFRDYAGSLGINPNMFQLTAYNRRFWEKIILNTFYAAALFHDIGYPWQFVNKIQDNLKHHDILKNDKFNEAEFIYESFKDKLLLFPLNGYNYTDRLNPVTWQAQLIDIIREMLNDSHGLPSAIAFTYLNDLVKKFPDENLLPWQVLCIDWASMIIMTHDLANFYGTVNVAHEAYTFEPRFPQLRLIFEKDPLSAILTLSDIIQDFERFNAEFDNTNPHGIDLVYNKKCTGVSIDWSEGDGILYINYKYLDPIDRYEKNKHIKKEEVHFFDPNFGYLDLSYLGVNQVKMRAIP